MNLVGAPRDNRFEQRLLRAEVVGDEGQIDIGPLRYCSQRRPVKALGSKHLFGSIQDAGAAIPSCGGCPTGKLDLCHPMNLHSSNDEIKVAGGSGAPVLTSPTDRCEPDDE